MITEYYPMQDSVNSGIFGKGNKFTNFVIMSIQKKAIDFI